MEKASLLIVEDELIVACDLQKSIENDGYVVAGHTDSGEKAIQLAGQLHPDLVLIDINLGGDIDGIEAAKQIRTRFDLPVIFLTEYGNNSVIKRALGAEPYGYILKPYDERELFIAIEMAITKHEMEKKLRDSEERYNLAVRGANDGVWDWDLKSNEINYSPRWKAMLRFKEKEISKSPDEWLKRVHLDDQKRLWQNLGLHLKGKTPHFECEYQIKDANGRYIWILTRGLAVRDAEGKAYRMAGSQTDVTARKMDEERLAYGSLHDGLAGLPNRELFMDRLSQRLQLSKHHPDSLFAVLFMDIDRFKVVNDSLGHAMGDQLLT